MEAQLSPSYTHEKLEQPNLTDLVDVFEDVWRNYIFSPAKMLLKVPNGEIAAMTDLCSYFEAIQSYLTGEDSDRKSKEFFVKGFCQVFRSESEGIEKAAAAIYKHFRCGLAHNGMLSHKVGYSTSGAKAFFLTYRKNQDGSLNFNAGVASIAINPLRIYQGVEKHFDEYVRKLRAADDKALLDTFQKSAERLWALGKGEMNIGMTEAEFLGHV